MTKVSSPLERIMGKQLMRGTGLKLKAEPMTLKRLIEIAISRNFNDYGGGIEGPNGENSQQSEVSCGIYYVNELSEATSARDQAIFLAHIMDIQFHQKITKAKQVILSDTMKSKAWLATKSHAYQGPITINPNTSNKIQLYIVTHDMLLDIYNSEE